MRNEGEEERRERIQVGRGGSEKSSDCSRVSMIMSSQWKEIFRAAPAFSTVIANLGGGGAIPASVTWSRGPISYESKRFVGRSSRKKALIA